MNDLEKHYLLIKALNNVYITIYNNFNNNINIYECFYYQLSESVLISKQVFLLATL